MNVRSAAAKIDDIIAMKRDQSIDVLCLCETWHDEDSVSIYDACARKARKCSNAPVPGQSASCRLCPQSTAAWRLPRLEAYGRPRAVDIVSLKGVLEVFFLFTTS